MPNKENQLLLLNLQGLTADKPEGLETRAGAAEIFSQIQERKEIGVLEAMYIERVSQVLSHRAIKTLARRGEVTFALIKPNVFEGKSLNVNPDLPIPIKDDMAADKIREEIVKEKEDGAGEILFDLSLKLTPGQAAIFYEDLKDRLGEEGFNKVVQFMSSGPITFLLLRHVRRDGKEIKRVQSDAVDWWRKRMGATNPKHAHAGTIRRRFARNIGNNIVHGSDSKQSVIREAGVIANVLEGYINNNRQPDSYSETAAS